MSRDAFDDVSDYRGTCPPIVPWALDGTLDLLQGAAALLAMVAAIATTVCIGIYVAPARSGPLGSAGGTHPAIPFNVQACMGLVPGWSCVVKFGSSDAAVVAVVEHIHRTGGLYVWPTVADEIRVAAGGDAADDQDGGGACREVTVEGLDASWDAQTVTLATEGADVGTKSTETFIRVNRAWCSASGGVGVPNTGAIVIETEAGSTVAEIGPSQGQTEQAIYAIPDGQRCALVAFEGNVAGGKVGNVSLYQRKDADDVSVPVSSPRLVHEINGLIGVGVADLAAPIDDFNARTDLYVAGLGAAGGLVINAKFSLLCRTL